MLGRVSNDLVYFGRFDESSGLVIFTSYLLEAMTGFVSGTKDVDASSWRGIGHLDSGIKGGGLAHLFKSGLRSKLCGTLRAVGSQAFG